MKRFLFFCLMLALINSLLPGNLSHRFLPRIFAAPTLTLARPRHPNSPASLHIVPHGNTRVKVEAGQSLPTPVSFAGENNSSWLSQTVKPLALAAGDFDEDGIADLLCAYANGEGGEVVGYRGNGAFHSTNHASGEMQTSAATLNDTPFFAPHIWADLSAPPDFIGVGDFDADGHLDIVTAARGGDRFYVLRGDGEGNFSAASEKTVNGQITALMSGEVNRADGLSDLLFGIDNAQGAEALVFASPNGAVNAIAEHFALPATAHSFAIGQLDSDYAMDIAVACGKELVMIHGRDRKLSLDLSQQAPVKAAKLERRAFAVDLQAIAIGDFVGDRRNDLAVLGDDGSLRVLSANRQQTKRPASAAFTRWQQHHLNVPPMPQATALFSAALSSQSGDSLIVADNANHQLRVVESATSDAAESVQATSGDAAIVDLIFESAPVAVLPLRLNEDGLSDLVIFRDGDLAPAIVVSATTTTFTVANTNDAGAGSLRQAILNANASVGADTITFDIGGGGAQTITLAAGLPALTETVIINATTQGGFAGKPLIEINGNAQNVDGLNLLANNCTVRGLVINNFRGDGIEIANANGAIIENNFIGTNLAGTATLPNAGLGVRLTTASNNRIGGTTATSRNLISGNETGVGIGGANSTGNLVQGNFIGTNLSGNAALGNGMGGGVLIFNSATNINNTIGGTAAAARNVIAGHLASGVTIMDSASGNLIQNNFIGTDVTGLVAIANADSNVAIFSANNTVGGTVSGARNLLSGSTQNGVLLQGNLATGNQVQGNFIGTNINGTAALANALNGVLLDGAVGNTIGGTTTAARNLISGNAQHGLAITQNAANNQVLNNFIGTTSSGASGLPNTFEGVQIGGSAANNFIGAGPPINLGNVIAFNGVSGVRVNGGTGNRVQLNSIFSNTGLGINLADDGVTPNDAGDVDTGPNNRQNFPLLTAAETDGSATAVKGTLNSIASSSYRLEFYSSPACDVSGNGEGQVFLGAINVATDVAGNANIAASLPAAVPVGQVVTATATDGAGSTSEFSACVTVVMAPCAMTCPANLVVGSAATQCGAPVSYAAPTIVGMCGTISCTPPSGSFFPLGVSSVNCTNAGGLSCAFTITVFDSAPPRIRCAETITVNPAAGQQAAVVNYSAPVVSDNCSIPTVICRPPAGASFPLGTTVVQCVARDEAGNEAACQFTITVSDLEAPVLRCPANLVADASPGQTTTTVNYPPPTVTDNAPGATTICVPPSGSAFALGVTSVSCTATDAAGNQSNCSFTINVRGGAPLALVLIPGGRTAVPFGLSIPVNPVRKNPKKKGECGFFKIRNAGFTPLILTLDSILRTGAAADAGIIKDVNEGNLYELSLINADRAEAVLVRGDQVEIPVGGERDFCLRFTPFIPAVINNPTALMAKDVLSNQLTSRITFRLAGGNPLLVNVAANLSTTLLFINGANPRKQAVVTYERRGNEFIFTYSVFDANLDVRKATFEFFDSAGAAFGQPIEVDLTPALTQANILKGQSFTIEQRFTGATTNPEVSGGRVTVFDGETSVSRVAEVISGSNLTTALRLMTRRETIEPAGTTIVRALP
ncbi:MAG: HYR domain-containing protein [Acidobacteria bacterium]|nr:HYR domain-containing protein [Acidobacteriota bacterium]